MAEGLLRSRLRTILRTGRMLLAFIESSSTPMRRNVSVRAVSAALAVILGGLIPFFLRTHQAVTDLTVILMIAAFLPAMISIRPLLDKWSLEHDTIYAITNYRVLALVKNNLMYIPLGRILTHSIEAGDG